MLGTAHPTADDRSEIRYTAEVVSPLLVAATFAVTFAAPFAATFVAAAFATGISQILSKGFPNLIVQRACRIHNKTPERSAGKPVDRPEGRRVVTIIGDASIVNGVAMEGLNGAGTLKRQFLVILNDNGMSISKPQGALAAYFDKFRLSQR